MSGPVSLPGGSLVRALVFAKSAGGSDELLGEADRGTAIAALLASVRRAGARIDALATEDERFVGLSVEFEALETVEARAVRILNDAGIEAYLQHTGGGVMVAEVISDAIADRFVWVTDSEGREEGPFFIGVYDGSPYAEEPIESLSGACEAEQLVEKVRAGLSQPCESSGPAEQEAVRHASPTRPSPLVGEAYVVVYGHHAAPLVANTHQGVLAVFHVDFHERIGEALAALDADPADPAPEDIGDGDRLYRLPLGDAGEP